MLFKAGGWECAVSVANVLEVAENEGVSPLPGSPDFVVGIKKFRDEIVPVINTVQRLSIPRSEDDGKSDKYIVILEFMSATGGKKIGALIDKVLSVCELPQENIKTVGSIGTQAASAEYIKGVVNTPEGFIYVLLPEYFFTKTDLQKLETVIQEEK